MKPLLIILVVLTIILVSLSILVVGGIITIGAAGVVGVSRELEREEAESALWASKCDNLRAIRLAIAKYEHEHRGLCPETIEELVTKGYLEAEIAEAYEYVMILPPKRQTDLIAKPEESKFIYIEPADGDSIYAVLFANGAAKVCGREEFENMQAADCVGPECL